MPVARVDLLVSILIFLARVCALDGIVTPDVVVADQSFQITFQNGGSNISDQYRVFLSAASIGQNGPMCYLQNLTSLVSPFNATIPASAGPDGTDYSIGIADITTSQGATFSNKFNFTGGNGTPSAYETQLNGAPFWNAYDLPCSAMSCARKCAQASYPADLTDDNAYGTMKDCIEKCPEVAPDAAATGAVNNGQANSIPVAVLTLASSSVLTAYETVITTGSSSILEAVLGSQTITLSGDPQAIASQSIGLASGGLVVGDTTTVPFTTQTQSSSATTPARGVVNVGTGIGIDWSCNTESLIVLLVSILTFAL